MATDKFGSRRIVVGAHYGFRDWLSQRVTASLMALFTIVLVVQVLFGGKLDYYRWSAIFAPQWMKVLAFVTIVSLLYHVWVGMRDIWMDYIKPVGVRLSLQVATMVWLMACAAWAVQLLWRPRWRSEHPSRDAASTSSSLGPAAPACVHRCNSPWRA